MDHNHVTDPSVFIEGDRELLGTILIGTYISRSGLHIFIIFKRYIPRLHVYDGFLQEAGRLNDWETNEGVHVHSIQLCDAE